MLVSVVIFAVGACIGSFLNVVILRSLTGKPLAFARSHCPVCKRTLRAHELIPVVSFLWLRGRCASCHAKLSWQYPLVELWMGVVAVLTFTLPIQLGASVLLFTILALITVLGVIDIRTLMLPDVFLVYLTVVVFLYLWINPQIATQSLFGALIGSGSLFILWAITYGRGIGFGDVKLMLPLGLLFGLWNTVALLFFAFVAGGLVAIILLATRRAHMKTAIAFGPFLIAAAALFLLWPALPDHFYSILLL